MIISEIVMEQWQYIKNNCSRWYKNWDVSIFAKVALKESPETTMKIDYTICQLKQGPQKLFLLIVHLIISPAAATIVRKANELMLYAVREQRAEPLMQTFVSC